MTLFVPAEFHAAEGRPVVLQITPNEYRPAVIVKCWGDPDDPRVAVNLVVFLDGSNDLSLNLQAAGVSYQAGSTMPLVGWATSKVQGPEIGQWRTRRPR
jgi:hypothetical protein